MIEDHKYIKFVSLISKDDKPLYIQSFDLGKVDYENRKDANRFLKYNFLSHVALDILASPMSLYQRKEQTHKEENGGSVLLFIEDEISVYGYETSIGMKIVIGLGVDSNMTQSEKEGIEDTSIDNVQETKPKMPTLASIFDNLYKCYVRVVCNPFTNITQGPEEIEKVLQTEKFGRNVKAVVDSWNNSVSQTTQNST